MDVYAERTLKASSCPPAEPKISTFQFLAFSAISISTVISIINAINNNNNLNNNDNNDNVNQLSGKRKKRTATAPKVRKNVLSDEEKSCWSNENKSCWGLPIKTDQISNRIFYNKLLYKILTGKGRTTAKYLKITAKSLFVFPLKWIKTEFTLLDQ